MSSLSERTEEIGSKPSFDRIIVVGESDPGSQHVTAWELSGIRAEAYSLKKASLSSKKGLCFDICVADSSARTQLIDSLLRDGSTVVVNGPISDKYETARRILGKSNGKMQKLIVLDPIKYHPLVTKTLELISKGHIGNPRILKLEILVFDKQLSELSSYSAIVNSISAMEIFFSNAKPLKVYAKKVKTEYSNFYVAVVTLENGANCQLICGTSSRAGKFEFSINGTDGMISFSESKTLEFDSKTGYSDAMIEASAVDVLSKRFGEYVQTGKDDRLESIEKYRIADLIMDSSRKARPVIVE